MLSLVSVSAITGGSLAILSAGLFLSPRSAIGSTDLARRPEPRAVIDLGRQLFDDTTLSTPGGMACVSCHDPAAGFSYPNSQINQMLGPVPGVVPGRFGFRKPPSAAYAAYLPTGVPYYDDSVQAYVGGLFYDGRAADTVAQAKAPFLNPNEMDNFVHGVGSPGAVVRKVEFGPSGPLFVKTYGPNVFSLPTDQVYDLIAQAIAAYERSPEVSPFSSKYDAYLQGQAQLTPQELRGLRIVTGTYFGRQGGMPFPVNAHCVDCHALSSNLAVSPDLWTNSCYANLGVPRNPNNPYYGMTDKSSDPSGYNPLGAAFVDYGLGDFLYPLMGKPSGDLAEGDPLAIDGTFKAPSLRNVDRRPVTSFVKCYMHNGVFKSLKEVVHFYNTRNLTTYPGEVIDFTKPDPYAGLKGTPLWPRPEYMSALTLINPSGLPGSTPEGSAPSGAGQVGNLGLTDSDEDAIVAFLQTLSDGYFVPTSAASIRP